MNQNVFSEYFKITIAMFIISFSIYFFLIPSGIVVGSISGLAMVIHQMIPFSISAITFVLNIGLLVIGFIFIGKEFGTKTVYTSILLPVFLGIFEFLFPVVYSLTNNSVYDLISYTLIIAFGQAILFNVNASSGGLDIVGKIVSKYSHMDIGKALNICGAITAMSSILVYDVGTLVVSLIGTYANGLAIDYFIGGFNKKKKICILSEDYEQIKDYIINTMKRGATLYLAKGAFDQQERVELVTIMTTSEYKRLLDYLHKSNYKSFVTVSTVNEVIGTWNINKRR
ncbi:YitT family protein [uncultured Faecalicoccus sp.]|uniref:YitT family protein n=1 Tax=uncultured Faecalicoccus sp. TaxID=1971760 RepID=UPI00262CBB17|nr:YitT family protein [uncultured Faecalicoccus sp.]